MGNSSEPLAPAIELQGVPYYPSTALLGVLGISRQTLWRWRKEGAIPSGHRFRDGRVFFTEDEVAEIRLFANRIEPAAAEIYLDNSATTRPLPEVREAMLEVLGAGFGNASSTHEAGVRARGHIRRAREAVAGLLGCQPESLFFTSGATEANSLVLLSTLKHERAPRIVTTEIEHSSVLKSCEFLEAAGVEVVYLPPDSSGRIRLSEVASALKRPTTLVSVHWGNSETGVLQPVLEIGEECRRKSVPFHTDAAQAVGKVDMRLEAAPIDLLSLSGHKLHGPQGVGAVFAHDPGWLSPLLHGGAQEQGLRPGTENLPGVVGLGKAAALRQERWEAVLAHVSGLRDRLESQILAQLTDVTVNGEVHHRTPNATNLQFAGVDGQALVARLDQAGIRCSQSSACTSMRPEPSNVLRAMGLTEEEAYSSVRFGFSEENTPEEVDTAVREITEICRQLRDFKARRRPTPTTYAGVR